MNELINWEKTLKPYFESKLRIIGEIPISEADLDELAAIIKTQLQIGTFTQATQRIVKQYPFTFMTLLAHFAAANDQAGYWEALQEKVGATQHLQSGGWHKEFLKLAKANVLKTFNKNDTSNHYVTTIRFHGGIPVYSLPDFFERMVEPAVKDDRLKELPPAEALKYLVETANVDKPVKDFINNSGEMGLAWFNACCKLVKHADENYGEILPRSEVPELPGYIHAFFEQYSESQSDKKFHWKKPYLELNPYPEEAAVLLRLPSQVVPLNIAEKDLHWVVSLMEVDTSKIIPCEIVRQGQDYISRDSFFALSNPTTRVTVSLSFDLDSSNQIRRWSLPLLENDAKVSLMAFKENFRHIPIVQTLPAEDLYLLTPAGSDLEIEGEARREGAFKYSSSGWSNWQVEHLSLKSANSLLVYKDGQPLGQVIPIAWDNITPALIEGHLFEFDENLDQPLYISEPPKISIPRPRNATDSKALAGWKVDIAAIDQAAPNIKKQFVLSECNELCRFEDDRILFSLRSILGDQAAGTYEIKVSNSKGGKSEFQIRLWPSLKLYNYSSNFPDTDEAKRPVKFGIRLPKGSWIIDQSSPKTAKITNSDGMFEVEAPPDARRISLNLRMTTPEGVVVQVSCTIPIIRLRWGLAEAQNPGEMKLDQQGIHISVERFLQYESSGLYVEMYGLAEHIGEITCQLVETDSEEHILQEAPFQRTGFSRDQLRVSLKQFADTIRASNSQVQFLLVFQKDYKSPPIKYSLLEVSPEMVVNNVQLKQVSDLEWRLTWEEDLPLKGRRVMLKSNWQPWQNLIEVKIPDACRGDFLFENLALPPSSYSVYFYIRRRWEHEAAEPPKDSLRYVIDLEDPHKRLADLAQVQNNPNLKFRNAIERSCIYDSLGDSNSRDQALSEAALPLKDVSDVVALVNSVHWMESKIKRGPFFSFFRKFMFHPKLVESILKKYPKDDPNLISYMRMIRLTETDSDTSRLYKDTAYLMLDNIDDPQVTSTCIRSLISRKDDSLISYIVRMIDESRLSANDAAEVLNENRDVAEWALANLLNMEDNPSSDILLTKLLSNYISENPKDLPEWLLEALKRAALVERSSDVISQYLTILSEHKDEDVFPLLFNAKQTDRIDDESFYDVLKRQPEESLIQLKNNNQPTLWSSWIKKLENDFPQAAGIISVGSLLLTPFGEASVVGIRAIDGSILKTVYKADSNFILSMNSDSGGENIDFEMDFERSVFYIIDNDCFFRCSTCGKFSHPVQSIIYRHHRSMHRYETFRFEMVQGKASFNPTDIEIL
ncbi:MAG: hypothetical protein GX933_06220 [Chloroflexi bacterium]|nr:hypothetical protein [Chloroflexota bacterium]